MSAAFHQGCCGNYSDLRFFLQFGDGQYTTVAHCGFHFFQGQTNIVAQAACVRNIGVNAFFEGQFGVAAHVVSLPVSCSGRAFAPVFFHVCAVDVHFCCGGFIETSKISAQHDEVCTHSQRQCHMVVIYDTTIGADGNVDACFFEVFISCLCYFDNCGSLTTADTFLFSCDTDGAAADTNFYEVSAAFSQETEAFCVYYVTCAYFYGIAVCCSDPFQSIFLPFAVAFGRVDFHKKKNRT